MTLREVYNAILIELNKTNAPNILLEDFNYFVNKAINQYVNKRYNIYDINQQTTDDLRVLKATAKFEISDDNKIRDFYDNLTNANTGNYKIVLPSDYLHILNCICVYKLQTTYSCYDKNDYWSTAATKLTADMYSQVIGNFWNKPSYKKPYYYINNTNIYNTNPTNPYNNDNGEGTDIPQIEESEIVDENSKPIAQDWKGINSINLREGKDQFNDYSLSQKSGGIRYGNTSKVILEIRYGDDSIFKLHEVYIDYIKAPQNLRLTQKEIDKTADTSQVLEFPDYVCQEIINELVHIIMENISDQRLQTHPVVSQSIANPAQQQTEPTAQQQPT